MRSAILIGFLLVCVCDDVAFAWDEALVLGGRVVGALVRAAVAALTATLRAVDFALPFFGHASPTKGRA